MESWERESRIPRLQKEDEEEVDWSMVVGIWGLKKSSDGSVKAVIGLC